MRNLAIVVALTVGCSHAQPAARFPDAPFQLGDDSDREQAIDGFWATPPGAARDVKRAAIADAFVARITSALADDQLVFVETAVFELAALWQDDPRGVGAALGKHVHTLSMLRATFAKSGAIEPTLCTLALLAEVDTAHRAEHIAEIDDILMFAAEAAADDTEIQHPAPAALLQPTVLGLPLPWLVDRYVAVLEAQQHAIDELFRKDPSFQVVGPATEVLQSARRIASALARAHRSGDIAKEVGKLTGLGEDRQLLLRATALAKPTPAAYAELAKLLRSEDHQAPDQAAALAVLQDGLVTFPTDPTLLPLAAESAAALGHVEQASAYYEAAFLAGPVDPPRALRLAKLYSQRIARLAFGGRPGAAASAWNALTTYTDHANQRTPLPVWQQVDAVAETALGRGLLSQGRITEAEHALVASIDRAPSIDAYETLTTIYLKTDHLASASHSATAGLALLGDGSGDRYRRAKLERLAADVMRAAGKTRDANALYLDALRVWTTLGEDKNLPRAIAAERKLEFAHGMWYLGNTDRAVDLILEAMDTAPDAPAICTDAVAFLLEVGKPGDAIDAVHRGLSAPGLGELDKVYVCLWALVDAKRRNADPDRQAREYLASRHGDLWYELLAQAATQRLDLAKLREAATTNPRETELAFYGTMLGLDPKADKTQTLIRVVDARLVMEAEYDLARQYLSAP